MRWQCRQSVQEFLDKRIFDQGTAEGCHSIISHHPILQTEKERRRKLKTMKKKKSASIMNAHGNVAKVALYGTTLIPNNGWDGTNAASYCSRGRCIWFLKKPEKFPTKKRICLDLTTMLHLLATDELWLVVCDTLNRCSNHFILNLWSFPRHCVY